jgi:hypothetical protein
MPCRVTLLAPVVVSERIAYTPTVRVLAARWVVLAVELEARLAEQLGYLDKLLRVPRLMLATLPELDVETAETTAVA